MSAKDNLEVEIKLKPSGTVTAVRRKLAALGYKVKVPRAHEANLVLDTPSLLLREAQQLLRIRTVGKKGFLTFKGTPVEGRHKMREEIELTVSSPEQMQLIFTRLGFREVFRYEKFRTTWAKPRGRGVITVDETPIGLYLELEGPPDWIDQTAAQLGFEKTEYRKESYGRLYQMFCEERGIVPTDMTFKEVAKAKL